MGEVVCVLGTSVSVVVAVLAAGPLCWQHEPFNAQLNPIGGMVGSLPRPPPIGLTCGSSGPRAGHRANMRVKVLTCAGCLHRNKRGTHGPQASRRPQTSPDTTEARPRTVPPLVARGRHAVGAEKSRYQQHVESYNPRSALLRPGLVDLGLSAVLPATEEHRQRRGQSRVLHANLDHGRARRLVGATAGNNTSGQRSGPTATQDKPRTPNGLTEHATI